MAAPASTSIATSLAAFADPPVRLVDGPAVDYFFIELVNTLRASSAVAVARTRKVEQEMIEAGLLSPPPQAPPAVPSKRDSIASTSSKTADSQTVTDEEEEALRLRLESIGMHVGTNVAERLCHERGLFADTLDAIKFICKELWVACWDKQVDNLRTNHRGVYVLQDNAFKPIQRISSWQGRADALRRAKLYAAMPAGMIKGALSRLGFQAVVVPEITVLPQCTFQVKLPRGS
ncbi:NO signaling/Golgi transport ligand-binding domain-containing protein [Irpex rosettiformis]|uniref:NO signaling/Golgi transport ligand-binding domain-containing protein n=1 Tax=Irpex rosettiformis TaxID=378272 RepID=A0ACB8TUI8_9APHY|nr:NO signaling/Golgi transport ligand-binding domain-containing protein [Irpex rosettiformis]